MRLFLRFAISFFVLCLVFFTFAYFLGPDSVRESIRHSESPVGQLNTDQRLDSPAAPPQAK